MEKPVLAIVGRPNTGKSTLFNAIAGRRIAIIGPEAGVTRDRIMAEADWCGVSFTLIDTGGIVFKGEDRFQDLMHDQVNVAIEMADVICFLTDLTLGLSEDDHRIAQWLRKSGKPVLVAVNKVDRAGDPPPEFYGFYELGFEHTLPISSTHKLGLSDLLDTALTFFPEHDGSDDADDRIRVAISGRPNAGKSSLANALLGEMRSIVSDVPGTTRDTIDSDIENECGRFRLIDTAGLRRKSRIDDQVEYVSAIRTTRAIERCDVSLVLIDAVEGPTEQDTKVAGLAHNRGKASIFVVNKWDLVERTPEAMRDYERRIRQRFAFMPYAPVLFLSAKTGARLDRVFPEIRRVYEASHRTVPTSLLNEVIADAVVMHPTPQDKGRHLKIYYATMTGTAPPTILFFINDRKLLHFSYERYLENRLRDNFDFSGTPLDFRWKGKAGRDERRSVVTPD